MEAVGKIAFENGGEFIHDTRREVEEYLSRGRTRLKGAIRLYAKAPIAVGLIAVSWGSSSSVTRASPVDCSPSPACWSVRR